MSPGEQRARPTAEILYEAFKASPIGIAIENFERHPLFVNPALCKLLGFSEHELLNKHCVEFSPAEDGDKDWTFFQQLRAGSIDHYSLDKRYFRRDGSLMWGRLSISLLKNAERPLVVAMVEDITARKLAEDRLREAQRIGQLGYWSWNPAIDTVTWSEELYQIHGRDPRLPAPTFKEHVKLFTPESWQRLQDVVDDALQTGKSFQVEMEMLRPDGTTRWIAGRGEAEADSAGRVVCLRGTVQDITERRRAEEALSRHAAIVESSCDGISFVTLDGVINTWNEGAQRMFGYTEKEAVGKPANITVPPELRDQQNKILEKLWAGGRIEEFETVRVSKTGKRIDVSLSISPVKDSTGKIVGCAGIARDITKRKRAEEALLSSEQRYRLLFERNVAGVAIGSLDGRVLDCNDGWAHILGYESRGELLGRHSSELYFNPHDRQPLLDELLEKPAVFSRELQLKRKDGSPVWVLFNAAALNAEHGAPVLQGTMIDISARKRAEEALSTVNQKLIEAHEEERTRIARELHDDINQRLALLSANVYSLKQGLPPSMVDLTQELGDLNKQLDELATDVQDLSHRLHSSKLEYLGLAKAADSLCRELTDRKKVEIDFHSENVPRELPDGISLCLFRALQEALQNAIKHSGSRQFQVSLKGGPDEIELTVRDSGKGFDPEAALKGRGIGLTSIKERLKLVNGSLSVDSRPNRGTTIQARVPLRPASRSIAAGAENIRRSVQPSRID